MTAAPHSARLDAIRSELELQVLPVLGLGATDACLLGATAKLAAVEVDELIGGSRRVDQRARRLFCLVAREALRRPWSWIADLVELDPSSVRSGVASAKRQLTTDPEFAATFEWLRERFDGLGIIQKDSQ